jgi:hypothetical protein
MDNSPRAWLERLGLSLIIIGMVLAWEGYKRATGRVPGVDGWRVVAYFAGAGVCVILGLVGAALRHRPRQ